MFPASLLFAWFGHRLKRPLQVLGVVIIGLAVPACGTSPLQRSVAPTVVEVIDGDTIVIDFDGDLETVRLLGIDTPETVDPNRPIQCFGQEASDFLTTLIGPGTELRVERDQQARDRFGRLLVYVFRASDGTFVNLELLRDGYADVAIYAPNEAYRSLLEHGEASARTAQAGLWRACGGPDVALDPPPAITGVD